MDELLGFALSQEELLSALLLADLPAPMGFDDLDTRVFGTLSEETRQALLAATERTLAARGLLSRETDTLSLDEGVRHFLHTCTQPHYSWLLLHQPAAQAERVSYFHQNSTLTLAHVENAGIHQFLQLSGREDVVATAQQLVAPLPGAAVTIAGHLPESAFATMAAASTTLTRTQLEAQLCAVGLDNDTAKAFAATLSRLHSITAFARFGYQPSPQLQRAFTVVRGEDAQWILTLSAPNTLHFQAVGGAALNHILEDWGRTNVA